MQPRISVAMATFDGAAFLRAQLDSIASQTVPPHELVICDDGSSDATVAIAEAFAKEAPFPVRVHRNVENLGFANNFLHCASMCTGDWIAFSDQDDVWYPHKLERIAAVIANHTSDDLAMLCHMADVVDETLSKTGRRLPEISHSHVKPRGSHYGFWCIGGCVMAVRSDLIHDFDWGGRPRDDFLPGAEGAKVWLPHDKWMCILANALGSTFYLAEALSCYRRHETTVTGSHDAPTFALRLRKATMTGSAYYRFRASVARETADSLRTLAAPLTDPRKDRLIESAAKFDELARVQADRAELYETRSVFGRLAKLGRMVVSGSYFGDPFFALGLMPMLKDVHFSLLGGSRSDE
jgi:glycosyltransferase involved in cell wall biosynthesis